MFHSAFLLRITVLIVISLASSSSTRLHMTLVTWLIIPIIGNQISNRIILGNNLLKLLDLRL